MNNTNNIKVSIIIPVYNVEQYIRECLDSVINQTLKEIEIICVDDCGTDNSISIVKEYANKDNRIKILYHNHNKGLGPARNTGIENAKGEYIMFLDSDDWYELNACEIMYNTIQQQKTDLAICGVNVIYEACHNLKNSDNKYFKIKFHTLQSLTEDILYNLNVSVWNKIWKKDIINKYKIKFPDLKYEDFYFFNFYTISSKSSIYFIQDKLYNYRRRQNSIMTNTFNKIDNYSIDNLKVYIKLYKDLKQNQLLEKYIQYITNTFDSCFYFALQHAPSNAKNTIFLLAKEFLMEEQINSNLSEKILQYNNYNEYELYTKIDSIYNQLFNSTNKIKILGFTILTIKNKKDKKKYYLFNFLPILTIKRK